MNISGREKILLLVILILLLTNIYSIYIKDASDRVVVTPETIDSMFVEEAHEDKSIVVHVTGQVNNKGIVVLKEGSRVVDAIQAAGGSSEEADLDKINLAKKLVDEKWIYVPAIGEEEQNLTFEGYDLAGDGKININTANASEFETLQGIGPVLAQRIMDFREKQGSFKTTEDIMKVSGIGTKIYEGIKDSIRVK